MTKINLGFGKYTEANLLVTAQAIQAAMTNNNNFPTPTPTLAAVQTAIFDYANALSAAKEGGKTNVAIKNQKKEDLILVLIALANYVAFTANGDEVMLTSSGFPLTKQKEPLPPLGKPEILKLEDGVNPGDLSITIAGQKGAKTFLYQHTQDPLTAASVWTGQNSTLTKFSFSDLESGKKHWCRVVAYGTNQQVVYSDPVARIVQ
jgi:hypothetical protein